MSGKNNKAQGVQHPQEPHLSDRRIDHRIEITKATIEATFSQKVDVHQLARQVNISASHLRHMFKAKTGLSLGQHITRGSRTLSTYFGQRS
jgi:transcriptional regulator GlxA family with amidase domain